MCILVIVAQLEINHKSGLARKSRIWAVLRIRDKE
jgi:hypothetical protein